MNIRRSPLIASTFLACSLIAQTRPAPADGRIDSLIARMTLEEKVSLLGGTGFDTRPIDRLGIPSLRMTDGPVGVRSGRTTAFPASVGMAATWDTALVRLLGAALGREAKARDKNVLLGPCVNIQRIPHGGRNFESFGEDPWLAGRMAVSYIGGVQSEGVAATVKHFAVNNQELERDFVDVRVRERALREIYLPAFEASVTEAGVLAVMNAYNKVNGSYCTENAHLNLDILKNEWAFTGLLMSDWGATHSVEGAATRGLDLEMPYGEHFGDSLVASVRSGAVREAVIDEHVSRILRLALNGGLYQSVPPPDTTVFEGDEHRQLNRQAARESMVLLKNDGGILPLNRSTLRTLAVVGPNAAVLRTGGGGSSFVNATSSVSPLEALKRSATGIDVRYVQGASLKGDLVPIDPALLRPAGGLGGQGWRAEYFDNMTLSGPPALTRCDARIDFDWGGGSPDPKLPQDRFSVRWSATLLPDSTGARLLEVSSDDGIRVWVDGALVIEDWSDHAEVYHGVPISLVRGKSVDIKVEYYERGGSAVARCGWSVNNASQIRSAVTAATGADAVVVFAGLSARFESEGFDRTSLELPRDQVELIKAVAAVNPRVVVVLNSGAPVLMEEWVGDVSAILEAWYPGQEGGPAIAELLFGDASPSGKLPFTYPRRWEDCSAAGTYPNPSGTTDYADGIYVGYRHFDKARIEPRFPFGFGLSYTTFAYENLEVQQTGRWPAPVVRVTFTVVNTGKAAAAEIAQIYVANPPDGVDRPVQELRGAVRVELKPGERRTVGVTLPARAFAYFDEAGGTWKVPAGRYEVRVGSSSRHIRSFKAVDLR